MVNKNKVIFAKFFKSYSENVDNADYQFFWRLSDEIIFGIISKYIKNPLNKNVVILDAGGGTGRWIEILSRKYKCKFTLYDLSPDMLKVAKNKKSLKRLGGNFKIIHGDIEKMSEVKDSSIDFIISIYNPVSFVQNPQNFFNEVRRILRNKGVALIMGQGFPNAISSKINNYLADKNELNKLDQTKLVKWNSSLAPLNVFSKESLANLALKARLNVVKSYGVPVFLQPGPEDFDSENKLKSRVSSKLESDKGFFEAVYKLEMKYNSYDSFVNRGMNILIVVQK